MAVKLPNGAILAIATGLASADVISAITNASPGVATFATPPTAGDELVITSGWAKLNSRIAVAGTVSGSTAPLTGIDTTDTTRYPAAGGAGSSQKVTGWQQITQVLSLQTSGGDQGFAEYDFLESDDQFQLPTTRSPQSLALSIGDDTSLPHFAILAAADSDRLPRALRLTLPSGSKIYYNCYITMNQTPSLSKGNVMALAVTASLLALPTRY